MGLSSLRRRIWFDVIIREHLRYTNDCNTAAYMDYWVWTGWSYLSHYDNTLNSARYVDVDHPDRLNAYLEADGNDLGIRRDK